MQNGRSHTRFSLNYNTFCPPLGRCMSANARLYLKSVIKHVIRSKCANPSQLRIFMTKNSLPLNTFFFLSLWCAFESVSVSLISLFCIFAHRVTCNGFRFKM